MWPSATAMRLVISLPPTSTIWASPRSLIWVRGSDIVTRPVLDWKVTAKWRAQHLHCASGSHRLGKWKYCNCPFRAKSAEVNSPDSLTTNLSSGMSLTSLSLVSKLVSKVLRLRLLMPISGLLSADNARSNSISSCTSTNTSHAQFKACLFKCHCFFIFKASHDD